MSTLFCFTTLTESKAGYKYWLLSFLVQCGIKLLRHKTPLIPVCRHRTEILTLCRSAVVYCWFPLEQMIKASRREQEAPCMSLFLCITSSVACIRNGAHKNRDNIVVEFVLMSSVTGTNWYFSEIQSRWHSATTETMRRSHFPFHSTQSETAYSIFQSHCSTPAADAPVIFRDKEGNYKRVLLWPQLEDNH